MDAGTELKEKLTDIPSIESEITNRKYGVKKFCDQFLSSCDDAQVVFLGSGIDPKSIDIAELYPNTSVFDVDMDNMQAKADINKKIAGPSNIAFCQADVSNAEEVLSALSRHSYSKDRPTLVVAEGITYYVSKELFQGNPAGPIEHKKEGRSSSTPFPTKPWPIQRWRFKLQKQL